MSRISSRGTTRVARRWLPVSTPSARSGFASIAASGSSVPWNGSGGSERPRPSSRQVQSRSGRSELPSPEGEGFIPSHRATVTGLLELAARADGRVRCGPFATAAAVWRPAAGRFELPESCRASQNSALPGVRGNGITSRMLVIPVINCTSRSSPMPKPEWGTVPKRRRSRYHQ